MILGIDASTTRIAVALLDGEGDLDITREWHLGAPDDERVRMAAAWDGMRRVKDYAHCAGGAVMGVFIESAYGGLNIKTSMRQAEWIGQVRALCWRLWPGALNEAIANSAWRKAAGVVLAPTAPYARPRRKDIKDATRAWARTRFGPAVDALSEDEIDALGVAAAGMAVTE